jgi:hypothetical protein
MTDDEIRALLLAQRPAPNVTPLPPPEPEGPALNVLPVGGATSNPGPALSPDGGRPQGRLLSWLLSGVALTLFAGAVSANAVYAWSLGASDLAGLVFAGIGISADALVFVLPSVAAAKWRTGRRATALVAWGIYSLALAFALTGSIGFSALNIADVATARAARTSPAIELAQRNLNANSAAVAGECKRRGPLCRDREADERQALADLAAAQKAVEAGADPQVVKAAQLVAWLTMGRFVPGPDDLAMARLALLTLLPQLSGLVLMVARR